jgi:hypothetical protein
MPGTGSVRAGEEKTPPILPFTTHKESDQRPRVCRRNAPGPTNAFAAESGRPTTFSVRTGPLQVLNPRTREVYVLVRQDVYQQASRILDGPNRRGWDDPELDVYEEYRKKT